MALKEKVCFPSFPPCCWELVSGEGVTESYTLLPLRVEQIRRQTEKGTLLLAYNKEMDGERQRWLSG